MYNEIRNEGVEAAPPLLTKTIYFLTVMVTTT